jgi:hypothetical protein
MEPDPNSPAAILGRIVGALPVVGLVARILSDDGGVGGDTVDFAEFRRRVSKKCTVMDSQAFYDFNERRGKVRERPAPFQCHRSVYPAGVRACLSR